MHINKQSASACISDTLLKLLYNISSSFNNSLSSIMVGNIITNVVINMPTPLQIALGVLLGDHKSMVQEFVKYAVVCSYDEVRRFKQSAAI